MCAPPRLTSPAGFCYSAVESIDRTNGNRRWTAATIPSRSPHERPCEGYSRRPFSRDILAPAPPPTELEVSLTQHPTSSTALVLTYVPWPSLPDHSGRLAGAQPHPGDNLGVPPRELRANPGAPNIEEARHITPRHHEDQPVIQRVSFQQSRYWRKGRALSSSPLHPPRKWLRWGPQEFLIRLS